MKRLEDYIRTVPDFPKEGIMFRDITTVLQDPDGFHLAIDELKKLIEDTEFDVVAGAEARGFILGGALAYEMHKSLVPVRKKGKLPFKTVSQDYELEYGSATLEIHEDAPVTLANKAAHKTCKGYDEYDGHTHSESGLCLFGYSQEGAEPQELRQDHVVYQ